MEIMRGSPLQLMPAEKKKNGSLFLQGAESPQGPWPCASARRALRGLRGSHVPNLTLQAQLYPILQMYRRTFIYRELNSFLSEECSSRPGALVAMVMVPEMRRSGETCVSSEVSRAKALIHKLH